MRGDESRELRETRRALEEARRRYDDLYEGAPLGFVTLDPAGLLEEMNLGAAQLLGVDQRHAVGMPFRGFVDTSDRQGFAAHLRSCAQSVGPTSTELHLRGREGRLIPAQVYSAPARPGPRGLCYRTALIDLTDLRRAEAERQRLAVEREAARVASEAKDRFLAMLSHELRNPLAPIMNSLYILEQAAPGSDQARRAHEVVARQVRHLSRLVDDLLDLSRITRDKIELRRQAIDLTGVVGAAVNDHRSLFEQRGVELAAQLATTPLHVHADAVRIAQVVGNVLHNAAKFTDRGGRVTVTLEASGGRAVVCVRDTGIGIAADMLPRLFDPFVQVDETLARSCGGLGLGLSLVKGIVELHGGTVSAESDGLGKGTTLAVRLPLCAPPAVEAAPAAPAAQGSLRVLVIDDNVDAADSLREVLEMLRHVVEVGHDGTEGIELARAFRPDVVLCDIGLPDIDGYAVGSTLRRDRQLDAVRLVALSGYAQPEDIAQSKQAGFDAHLAKPLSVEALEQVLGELTATR